MMCEINPKHAAYFRLEAFTSDPNMSTEEFTRGVMARLLQVEMQLNADGRFRFHIHADEKDKPDYAHPIQDAQLERFFEEDR